MSVTRKRLRDGFYERMVVKAGLDRVRSKDERDASRRAILRASATDDDLWVFAYGSLIWNPTFHFVERKRARIHGYHRSFCLWSNLGRGTTENPGLMLGLNRGGACAGVLYRIVAEHIEEESELIWAREMTIPVYDARWVTARTAAGPIRAVTFVVDRVCDRYAGRLSIEQLDTTMATARGKLGSSFDYLRSLTDELDAMGIEDRSLRNLRARVEAKMAHPV